MNQFVVRLFDIVNGFHIIICIICTGREARTPDTWFWRPVLYQLSYARIFNYYKFLITSYKRKYKFVICNLYSLTIQLQVLSNELQKTCNSLLVTRNYIISLTIL